MYELLDTPNLSWTELHKREFAIQGGVISEELE
jgi:hypothetical protein